MRAALDDGACEKDTWLAAASCCRPLVAGSATSVGFVRAFAAE